MILQRNIFFALFSPFRVFSQFHSSYAEMILYCEKLRKNQTYAKIVSHTESTETTEIFFSTTDCTDFTNLL